MERDPTTARRKITEEVHTQWRKKLGFDDPKLLWTLIISCLLLGLFMPSFIFKGIILLGALTLFFTGVGIPQLIIWRRFRKWKKKRKLFDQSPEGKIHTRIREFQAELKGFQQKVDHYSDKISEGEAYRTQLQEAQLAPGLSQSRKAKNQQLIDGLDKNIDQQKLLLQFYQESLNRLNQETLNLEQDLKHLEVMDYLQGQKEGAYEEHVEVELTQLKTEFLDEIGRLESAIPDVESQELSAEFQLQLEDMIQRLRNSDSEDEPPESLSEFSDFNG